MRKIKNQLIINLIVLIAPLVVALLSYNFYGLSMINTHVASAGQSILETYGRILEQDLQLAQDYLTNKLSNDSDTLSLNYTDNYLDSYLIGENILSDFEQFMQAGFDSVTQWRFMQKIRICSEFVIIIMMPRLLMKITAG